MYTVLKIGDIPVVWNKNGKGGFCKNEKILLLGVHGRCLWRGIQSRT